MLLRNLLRKKQDRQIHQTYTGQKGKLQNAMKEHTDKDIKSSKKEYKKVENKDNYHAKSWAQIMNLGSDFGHEKRVAEAVTIKNSKTPDLYGSRKKSQR